MNEEQYDTLLNGILNLGVGQRRLTRLMMELAQASAEQEERIEQVVGADSDGSGYRFPDPLASL